MREKREKEIRGERERENIVGPYNTQIQERGCCVEGRQMEGIGYFFFFFFFSLLCLSFLERTRKKKDSAHTKGHEQNIYEKRAKTNTAASAIFCNAISFFFANRHELPKKSGV